MNANTIILIISGMLVILTPVSIFLINWHYRNKKEKFQNFVEECQRNLEQCHKDKRGG